MKFNLPIDKTKIGVFVSGGLDSAVMYYLVLKANKELGNLHEVVPFRIPRTEGSAYFSHIVTAYVQSLLDLPHTPPKVVGDMTMPGHLQVKSGCWSAVNQGCTELYVGAIKQLPEHQLGEIHLDLRLENPKLLRIPFYEITKDQVVEIAIQNGLEELFHITHSCSILEAGRCNSCNGCNERSWAFSKLGLIDPGKV